MSTRIRIDRTEEGSLSVGRSIMERRRRQLRVIDDERGETRSRVMGYGGMGYYWMMVDYLRYRVSS
jgi:hypothetical protein